jgi:PAS domain S-box-containing protein
MAMVTVGTKGQRILWVDQVGEPPSAIVDALDDDTDIHPLSSEADGESALEQLATVDCIVSGHDPPAMDGIALLRAVRERNPNVPFLFFASRADEPSITEALNAGANAYLERRESAAQTARLVNHIERAVAHYRTQQTEQQDSEHLQGLLQGTNDVLWMFSPDWEELLFVSGQYEEVWGQSVESLRENPESFLDGIYPPHRERVQEAMGRLSNGEEIELEYRVNPGEGFERWVVADGQPVYDDGELAYLVGFCRDITESRRNTEKIREQAEQINTVVGNLPVALFALDADGTFTLSKGQVLRELGLEPGEVVGQQVRDVYADSPEILDAAERALDGNAVDSTVDIAGLTLRTRYRPVYDDGALSQVIGVALDITEQKAYERELEQQRSLLEAVSEASLDGKMVVDENQDIILYNDRFTDMWEIPPSVMQSNSEMEALDYVLDDLERPEEFLETVEYLYDHPGETSRDIIELEDGRVFDRYSDSVEGPDGSYYGRVWSFRDITERKERERQLRESNKRLEQFAYVASHDLQEPLRTVSNYTELIAEEYQDDLDDEAERLVEVVVTASQRMQSMINGLLDYSRVTTRGDEFEPVDTGDVLEGVLTDVDLMLEENDGTVRFDDLPVVEADGDQLQQVFQNLITNALEHSDEGPLTIEVRATEQDDSYRFEVADDGPGIAENRQEKIFRIFKSETQYQTSSQAKGIGLAVCDNIVQRHGGEIWVESEPGHGSTFVFTLAKQSDNTQP